MFKVSIAQKKEVEALVLNCYRRSYLNMSQLFMNPGDVLEGLQKSRFNDIKKIVDRATNDLLMRADWEAVLQCCDMVNGCLDDDVINELVFLLRRKLGSIATIINPVSIKQVQLTLSLTEALVKNCGTRLHRGVNDETFMTEMKRVARRYANRAGAENVKVAELTLDVIQAWGEGFLTRRRQFPNIVEAYHELKKEGMPFRAQYDPSRVPIFTPDGDSASNPHSDSTDAILASMSSSGGGGGRASASGNSRVNNSGASGSGKNSKREQERGRGSLVDALHTSVGILGELLMAAVNDNTGDSVLGDIATDDVARELVSQIQTQQELLTDKIEALLLADASDAVAALFSLNDEVSSVLEAYRGASNGSLSDTEINALIAPLIGKADGDVVEGNDREKKDQNESQTAATTDNLLDFDNHSQSPRSGTGADAQIQTQASSTNASSGDGGLLDFLSGAAEPMTAAVKEIGGGFSSGDHVSAGSTTQKEIGTVTGLGSEATDTGLDLLDFGMSTISTSASSAPGNTIPPAPVAAAAIVMAEAPKKRILPLLPPPPGPQQHLQQPPPQQQQQQEAKDPTNPFDLF